MPRQSKLARRDPPEPDDIRAAMVTGEFDIPPDDHFKGMLTADQISAIQNDTKLSPEERDRRTQLLLGLSIHAQWGDWTIDQLANFYAWIQRLDYEQARRKVEQEKHESDEQEKALLWKFIRWSLPTIFGAALIVIGQYLAKRWLGP